MSAGYAGLHDEVSDLLDLPEELLARVLSALADAASLCRTATTCRALAAMSKMDSLWRQQLHKNLGVVDTAHPSAAGLSRFRSFFSLERLCWTRLCMTSRDESHHMLLHPPASRTGSATCRLGAASLIFGGTLGGNSGPFLDDLFCLHVDVARQCVELRCVSLGSQNEDESVLQEIGVGPGPRRGHTMTAVQLGGHPAAVVLGGWSHTAVDMQPHILTPTKATKRGFKWSCPQISGAAPDGRAFHSATALGGGIVLVYGGLGDGCCRGDFAVLDLDVGAWSSPVITGIPRCVAGRAGHGAIFVPDSPQQVDSAKMGEADAGVKTGGRLFLVAGASRSVTGDAHQDSVICCVFLNFVNCRFVLSCRS